MEGAVSRIFVVEDDDDIREMVLYALSSAGFSAGGFADGESFFRGLEKAVPALILLDVMLPGEDGVAILKKLRNSARTRKIPVIMLTAKSSELDRIRGLDGGADDYIPKPFSVLEVLARVRAVLRRCGGEADGPSEIRIGEIALNAEKRAVMAAGGEIALTYKEFELLHFLMANEGVALSRDRLLERIWGFDYGGESRTVDMHIKTLRQKLGSAGEIIRTVRNVGYKIGD